MQITETIYVKDRDEWREWLIEHHATVKEIWLIYYNTASGKQRIPYLHAVEEALCFGWIDGVQMKMDAECTVQRFTPRRPKSNWSSLNKERARRLIENGKMTEAGLKVLPDLSLDSYIVPEDILKLLQEDPQTWENFCGFPAVYQRIRIGYIDESRKLPDEFQKRLTNFLKKTGENKMYGIIE
jgi:uncharacterized protein YdeI (YjbR/CyaY-like superfamily)